MAKPLMGLTLDRLRQGDVSGLLLGFAVVLLLLAIPVVVLGAASPVLVHEATRAGADVGGSAGHLGAVGTLGSLAGTFVCGIVLVPLAGTTATFLTCGGLAMVAGATGAVLHGAQPRRTGVAAALAGLVVVGVAVSPSRAASHSSHEEGRLLVERETPMNHLRVMEDKEHRTLSVNDGYAAQTVARVDGRAYLRGVWGYYAVAPGFAMQSPERILVLGLGGGTSARDYVQRLPKAEVVAVEVDSGIVAVARSHFGLPPSVEVHVEDARTFLAHDTRHYDLIVVDAFQFPYIPFQLTTREFYAEVRDHLQSGGAVMVNVGRKGQQRDVVHAIASTLQTAFRYVHGTDVPHATNTILVATDHPLSEAGGTKNVGFDAAELASLSDLVPLALWAVPADQRLVLTDDRAPVEWLTNTIVFRELARLGGKATDRGMLTESDRL